jgi:AraC family transcriptional regulator
MLGTGTHRTKRGETAQFHAQAVSRVISAIRGRLDDSISLKEMAALAYMSRFHFNRTFRQVTGLPPRRFLSALRVEAATRLLLDTNHSVTDICMDVGYNSLGISPMKLRDMRQSSTGNLLEHAKVDAVISKNERGPFVIGRIQAPETFSGPIFVGLFATSIPEGAPTACTIQHVAGSFQIPRAPRGRQYLFAVGLPWPEGVDDYFKYDSAMRGGGDLVCVDSDVVQCREICLRPAMSTDPPILLNLPVLLSKARALCEAA